MNCKPGDLAVVVGECDVSGNYLLGRIFKLTECFLERGESYWEYEGNIVQTPWGSLDALADDNLRPIRPGDISDEDVRDLYAPKVPEAA